MVRTVPRGTARAEEGRSDSPTADLLTHQQMQITNIRPDACAPCWRRVGIPIRSGARVRPGWTPRGALSVPCGADDTTHPSSTRPGPPTPRPLYASCPATSRRPPFARQSEGASHRPCRATNLLNVATAPCHQVGRAAGSPGLVLAWPPRRDSRAPAAWSASCAIKQVGSSPNWRCGANDRRLLPGARRPGSPPAFILARRAGR